MSKILIVDDNAVLLETISDLLITYGYEVDILHSATKALKQLGENQYDMIISDVNMPGITGMELLERIRNTVNETIPVILMTGEITTDYAIKAIRLGASDFIGKPIDVKGLLHAIKLHLKRNKQQNLQLALRDLINVACMEYTILPSHFLDKNLSSNVINHLDQMLDMPRTVFNTVQLCIDEMLQNAFVHGTLKLSVDERSLSHVDYLDLVKQKLEDEDIAAKKITMFYRFDQKKKLVEISVQDEGDGFFFNKYLTSDEVKINLDSTGRGLTLIKALTDSIKFDDNGRRITITKSYGSA
jgi:DNA-binding response OmpR family regulator